MTLGQHVVLGGGAALAVAPVLGTGHTAIFFAATVLIDVDHYWDYLVRCEFRSWSWRKFFAYHRALVPHVHAPDFLALSVFHTVEAFAAVYLAGVYLGAGAAFAALLGMAYHLLLDVLALAWRGRTFKRALSLVEYHVRRRRLQARGFDPDRVHREALIAVGVPPLGLPAPALTDPAS